MYFNHTDHRNKVEGSVEREREREREREVYFGDIECYKVYSDGTT